MYSASGKSSSFLVSHECVVDAGVIEATYAESVTQQMIAIHKSANAHTPSTKIMEDADTGELRGFYVSLEGVTVVFNEIAVQLIVGDDYNIKLT